MQPQYGGQQPQQPGYYGGQQGYPSQSIPQPLPQPMTANNAYPKDSYGPPAAPMAVPVQASAPQYPSNIYGQPPPPPQAYAVSAYPAQGGAYPVQAGTQNPLGQPVLNQGPYVNNYNNQGPAPMRYRNMWGQEYEVEERQTMWGGTVYVIRRRWTAVRVFAFCIVIAMVMIFVFVVGHA
jgi:hypothetical protein